ncbi:MAG: alpha-amylase domain-containing protein [Saprospiraceae bacterium]
MKVNRILLIYFVVFFIYSGNSQDIMMQGWYWDYPKTSSGYDWANTLTGKASELANAGFTYVWLPPMSRASFGSSSNGYDPKDLYDLGEYGLGPTGFGSRSDVDALISAFNNVGINAVADVVYNHRDGGSAEDNGVLKNFVNNYGSIANSCNPFPYDRYRVLLPLGGSSGNGAGDYYFKISSASQLSRFSGRGYKVYMQTNEVGWQNQTAIAESEPNGGGDCSESNNDIYLGIDMTATVDDPTSCSIDEFHLSLTAADFDANGDTLFIYFGTSASSDYSDMRIFGIWSSSLSEDIVDDLIYQTYTDFTNMPSGQGQMTFENFKPNSISPMTCLSGDWDWLWFFYDYDQNVPDTKLKLQDWTRWLWNDVGVRGLRMDAVKHFPPDFVGGLLDNLHTNGIDPGMVVGEYYDANPSTLSSWISDVYSNMNQTTILPRVFDFSLRQALENASDTYGYDVRNVFSSGLVDGAGGSGFNAVTFINNHDFRDSGQAIDNDPILAYAYILTNNQIGIPCVFYPDYYYVSGFPGTGMKTQIDQLIQVHQDFIYGSSSRDYLTKFSTTYNPYYISGTETTTLVYQLMNTNSGKDVIVGINYAGDTLDMWVGVNSSGLSEGDELGDQIGNALVPTLTVSGGRVNIKLPPRSYAVWVENQTVVLPLQILSFTGHRLDNDVVLNWEVDNNKEIEKFEIERTDNSNTTSINWEKIGTIENDNYNQNSEKYTFTDKSPGNNSFLYRLKQIDYDGNIYYSSKITINKIYDKSLTELYQNNPNPFSEFTKISWNTAKPENLQIRIIDISGKLIDIPYEGYVDEGYGEIILDNKNISKLKNGIYYYQLITDEDIITKKMVLIK